MLSKRPHKNVNTLIMEEIKDVKSCLIGFESFMRAAVTPQTVHETLVTLSDGVCDAEAAADGSLRRMIDSLSNTAFLPATRSELIDIATGCDRVANKCEHTAKMIVLQRFRFPEEFNDDVMKILSITHEQFEILEQSISSLFSDFSDLLKDHSILDEIRAHETQVDIIETTLYERIFTRDTPLAEKTQTAHFVELLCDLSDIIENLADKIQIMLITRKA
ncbi:MAG: DUF47 family protein [Clostridia bacterium]|nr:DUF47 family protein [Clostridia bacterium]